MKVKLIAAVVASLLLSACGKQATEAGAAIGEFKIDRLFTIDGCTVYRFSDAGHLRYFTNCKGSVNSSYTYQAGKTPVQQIDEIQTEVQR